VFDIATLIRHYAEEQYDVNSGKGLKCETLLVRILMGVLIIIIALKRVTVRIVFGQAMGHSNYCSNYYSNY
jgi:hypothetical protein